MKSPLERSVGSQWVLLLIVVTLFSSTTLAFDDNEIKCVVCLRAVEHMWHRGVIMRDECAHPDREMEHDDQCYLGNLKLAPIAALVNGTCEDIINHYQAKRNQHGHVDLHLHNGEKDHTEEQIAAIQDSCTKWIHDEHVGQTVFANLFRRKSTDTILYPMQQRFCQKPCLMKKKPPRKRPPPHEMEKHHNWDHWADRPHADKYGHDINLEHQKEGFPEYDVDPRDEF